MKAPSRKLSRLSSMALLLGPMSLEGKRQAVALGQAVHRIDMAVAQTLDEPLKVACPQGEVLARHPAAGEDGEGLEIAHAAEMCRLVERAQEIGDLEAVAPAMVIGGLGAAGRD